MHHYIDELRLLQAIRLAVLATDSFGSITFVNRAATEVFATVDAELVGRPVHDLIAQGASAAPLDLDAVLAGETWRGDLTLRRPHGDTFVAAVSGTPIRDATGQVTGIVVVAEDMSQIRTAQTAAAASEARLRLAHEAAQLGSWHWNLATEEVV